MLNCRDIRQLQCIRISKESVSKYCLIYRLQKMYLFSVKKITKNETEKSHLKIQKPNIKFLNHIDFIENLDTFFLVPFKKINLEPIKSYSRNKNPFQPKKNIFFSKTLKRLLKIAVFPIFFAYIIRFTFPLGLGNFLKSKK